MIFDIITIFPHIFDSYLKESLLGKAIQEGIIKIRIINLRDFTSDKRKTVDDRPFGGERGMVVKIEPVLKAVSSLTKLELNGKFIKPKSDKVAIVTFSPRAKKFNQKMAYHFSKLDRIIMICGRYEGIDERIIKYMSTFNVSSGDYVLMGGELASFMIIESVSRLIPGVIGKSEDMGRKRITSRGEFIEYPQYTRPAEFDLNNFNKSDKNVKWKVPKILLSGNHRKIEEWRQKHSKLID